MSAQPRTLSSFGRSAARTRQGALVCGVVVLLAACGADRPAAEVAPRRGPLAPATATTALAPPDEPAPVLALTGDDVAGVYRSLTAYRSWLFRHPDPVGLDAILDPACPCLEREAALLREYAGAGRWWTGAEPTVVDVAVLDHTAPDLVTLRVTTVRDGPTELVDAAGTVHDTRPPSGPSYSDVVLLRADPGAPWRVRDVADQGPAPGVSR